SKQAARVNISESSEERGHRRAKVERAIGPEGKEYPHSVVAQSGDRPGAVGWSFLHCKESKANPTWKGLPGLVLGVGLRADYGGFQQSGRTFLAISASLCARHRCWFAASDSWSARATRCSSDNSSQRAASSNSARSITSGLA